MNNLLYQNKIQVNFIKFYEYFRTTGAKICMDKYFALFNKKTICSNKNMSLQSIKFRFIYKKNR